MKKMLAVDFAGYLPVFGAMLGVILFVTSLFSDNATKFLLSMVIFAVLPPVLEEVGNSLKEKYGTMQNEVDIIAIIPEWSLGLEVLASIVIIVVFAVLKNIVISYLGVWLLALSGSLSMAKKINELKEDLQSPDLEKRHAAIEKVEFDEQIGIMIAFTLLFYDLIILAFGHANFTPVETAIMIALLFAFPLPALIVFEQSYKVMPPESEKATHEVRG
jgi:multisubunit Na+/H+ antiporter MnhG subunit